MKTALGKGLLAGLALLMAVAAAPRESSAAQQEEVLYEAPPALAPGQPAERMLAKADSPRPAAKPASKNAAGPTVPDNEPVAVVTLADDSTNAGGATTSGGEKIEVNFREKEQDILTKEALEKLNTPIESLEFVSADLHNVIRILGERLNINFIFDAEDINGKVTLRLHNVRLRDALDSILSTRKLAIVADHSGIFRIVPQERVGRKSVETKTEVLQLNWLSAVDVAKTMEPFLSDDSGKIKANEESNSLIVTDVPPQIETIRNLLKQLDLPERQVLIEARLADVNVGALRNLESNWSLTQNNTDALASVTKTVPWSSGAGVLPVLVKGFGMSAGKGTLSLGETVGIFGSEYNLNATFTALENRKLVEILANPRVTTLNNVPANISIVEKIPYQQASGLTSSGTQVPTISWEKAGVEIKAKPIITPNGFVRMEIQLKQMIFRERVGGGDLDPPAIDERNADTNVIVENENTVVLGGLRQQRRLEGTEGLPWLHQVPFFGWLFKNKNYDHSRTELVLMITPTIIKDKVSMSEREKYWYDKIDNTWNLPDYFFDDVKNITDEKDLNKRIGVK